MANSKISPPGEHPFDSSNREIDPIGFALERVQTMLHWSEEHRASFEKLRNIDPTDAANELDNLRDAHEQAVLYLHRLTELLLTGLTIDPQKPLPKGLCNDAWLRMVEIFLRKQGL